MDTPRRIILVVLMVALGMGQIQGAEPAAGAIRGTKGHGYPVGPPAENRGLWERDWPGLATYPQGCRPPAMDPVSPLASDWVVEQADARKYTRGTGERSLALDSAGRPHLVYGQVYYAWHDGTAWQPQKVADGEAATLALDALDRPYIAYVSSGAVLLARHDGTAWHIERVDDGVAPALALDALDRPHLSYDGLYGIQYAWFDGAGWSTETVAPGAGGPSSLAVDSNGHPHLAYGGPAGLSYAYHDGTSWSTTTVDSPIPARLSLALDSGGRPHIAYQKAQVYYAHLAGAAWVTETVDAYPSYTDAGVSLVMDPAGRPHLSYSATESVYDLLYAYHDGTSWVSTLIDSGWSSSLALGVDGYPQIGYGAASSYPWATLPVLYARYDGAAWHKETVDVGIGPVGGGASMALDAAGRPHFSYGELVMSCVKEYLRYAVYDGTAWILEQACICELQDTSLALDAAAYPHLLLRTGGGQLTYRYSDGSTWFDETLAGGAAHSALALDGQDQPRAAYSTAEGLWYASRDADGWHVAPVDATAFDAALSLALDAMGRPHLAYTAAGSLYVSTLDQGSWIKELVTTGAGAPSLDLDSAGQPHVAYLAGGSLYSAHREGAGWQSEEIDSGVTGAPSLAVDAYRRPHVAYHKAGFLYYASYAGGDWWTKEVSGWPAGEDLTLLLDASGLPHIGFTDAAQGRVLWAHDTGCTPITEAAIEGPSAVPLGIDTAYVSTFAPPTCTLPAVAWGDGAVGYFQVYSWTTPGSYTLSLTATSPCATVYASKAVSVFCQPVQEVEIQGPAHQPLGVPAFYTASYAPLTTSLPLTMTWDNGAMGPTVSYTWMVSGVVTQSVTAVNLCSQVEATSTVVVFCQPVEGLAAQGPAVTLINQPAAYRVVVEPITASRPLTLTWDNGASGLEAVYTWPETGTYTVTVTATNACGVVVQGSLAVRVLAEWPYYRALPVVLQNYEPGLCVPVAAAAVAGPAELRPGETGLYTATVSPPYATPPLTMTWDNGVEGPAAAYSWTLPGLYTLTVTATNPCGEVSATLAVSVTPALCRPVQTVVITGFLTPCTYEPTLYTATVFPPTATAPLTVTWDNGSVGLTAVYSFTEMGGYTLTVTATNACGQVHGELHVVVCPEVAARWPALGHRLLAAAFRRLLC